MPISPVNCFVGFDIAPSYHSPLNEVKDDLPMISRTPLMIPGTGHPYKTYRSQGHRLGHAESPIIIAGPIMNHAAQPRPDSRSGADKQRDGADNRTEGLPAGRADQEESR